MHRCASNGTRTKDEDVLSLVSHLHSFVRSPRFVSTCHTHLHEVRVRRGHGRSAVTRHMREFTHAHTHVHRVRASQRERERERERERARARERERGRERERAREGERESVCVRERERVRQRDRDTERDLGCDIVFLHQSYASPVSRARF
jgi:hypothetical protein